MPQVRDKRRYNLAEIARRIEALRISPIGEPASFQGFEIEYAESILESGLEFHEDVAIPDIRRLIRRAISNAATNGAVTEETLTKALHQVEVDYLKQPPTNYILITSINLSKELVPTRRNIGSTTIVFSRKLPKQFNRAAIQEDVDRFIQKEKFNRLINVRVSVQARTSNDAINRALDSLDFVRGIWNFAINNQTRMRHTIGFQKHTPFNNIIIGPFHTLHSATGTPMEDTYWYEMNFPRDFKLYDLSKHWNNISEWEVFIRRKLQKISYANELRDIFIRYTRSLDNSSYDIAFTKLWAVLEGLTNAPGQYQVLIRRCLFLEIDEDKSYTQLILEHLRDLRNGLIHDDRSRNKMLTHVYQLKSFIEALINFHLFQGAHFKTFTEACEFLDLPTDVNTLKDRLRIYNLASEFRSKRTK